MRYTRARLVARPNSGRFSLAMMSLSPGRGWFADGFFVMLPVCVQRDRPAQLSVSACFSEPVFPAGLRMPGTPDDTTLSEGPVQTSTQVVGPYRLIQMVGAGGMGEVWQAAQEAPFHRTVALKLIKAGMDTKAV